MLEAVSLSESGGAEGGFSVLLTELAGCGSWASLQPTKEKGRQAKTQAANSNKKAFFILDNPFLCVDFNNF